MKYIVKYIYLLYYSITRLADSKNPTPRSLPTPVIHYDPLITWSITYTFGGVNGKKTRNITMDTLLRNQL